MCKASKLLNEIKESTNSINQEHDRLNNLCKKYDQDLSSMYHKIESKGKFDACTGYYIAKEIQLLLQKRRITKHERDNYKSIIQSMNIKSLTSIVEKASNNVKKLNDKNRPYTCDWDVSLSDIESDYLAQ